jgi:molybdopterin synthase catalytic subunit
MTMNAAFRSSVLVQEADFDVAVLQGELLAQDCSAGAIASFTGLVRANNEDRDVYRMTLEHYPGMTQGSIQAIVDEAASRWALQAVSVIHRVGELTPGEQIVYVGVAGSHRGEAFAACEFIMDYLKTRAPFWKKEVTAQGEFWVESRGSDQRAADRWRQSEQINPVGDAPRV